MNTHTRPTQRLLRLLAIALLAVTVLAVDPAMAQPIRAPRTLAAAAAVQAGPVTVDFDIQYVGVIYDTAEHGVENHEDDENHGQVRVRRDGRWGPWTELTADGAQAAGTWTAGLVAVDDADAYQVRNVPDAATNARAVAINTTDGPLITVGHQARGTADAIANDRCVTRAQWGADESLMTWAPEFYPAQAITVHHTGGPNDNDIAASDPDGLVRAIYRYHAVDNGWGDIGYQYLVDPYGNVYEGRSTGTTSTNCAPSGGYLDDLGGAAVPPDGAGDGNGFAHDSDGNIVTAAHTPGANSGNLGISVLGHFDEMRGQTAEPTAAAVSSVERLVAVLATRHRLDPQGTIDYVNPSPSCTYNGGSYAGCYRGEQPTVSGHRDWDATACPGDALYAMLPGMRTNAAALMGSIDEPTVGTATVTVTAPADGATVDGVIGITADASADTGVKQVDFYIGETLLATDMDGTYATTLDTTGVVEGTHTITATVTATDGATATDRVTVTVDNEPDAAVVHVGDLDGTVASKGSRWDAVVTVTVHDTSGQPVTNATVTGTWDTTGPVTCTTGGDGTCQVASTGMHKRTKTATFAVSGIAAGTHAYDASGNTDPDGDSDGTRLIVSI